MLKVCEHIWLKCNNNIRDWEISLLYNRLRHRLYLVPHQTRYMRRSMNDFFIEIQIIKKNRLEQFHCSVITLMHIPQQHDCTFYNLYESKTKIPSNWDYDWNTVNNLAPLIRFSCRLVYGLLNFTLRWRHMNVMYSQMTSHSTVCSQLMRTHIKETSKSALLAVYAGNSPAAGEFPAQRASNAEKASIWWLHHEIFCVWSKIHILSKTYMHCKMCILFKNRNWRALTFKKSRAFSKRSPDVLKPLQWRHSERHGLSNHQPYDW